MYVDVLIGLQWGDEGKGKIVDYLADRYDIVARFQGGPNAGHTLKVNGETFVLHTIPSGIFHGHITNVIGNGVVIDPITFKKEVEKLNVIGVDATAKLMVSNKAHLILPTHKLLDAASEARKGQSKIGSTLRGIGPTYMDQTGRNGLRVGDIVASDFQAKYEALKEKHLELLKFYNYEADLPALEQEWMESLDCLRSLPLINAEYYLNEALASGKRILAEGAQGSMLDVNFGTYPYVTSSNTLTAGACIGLGVAPSKIREVYGISKAYCTRVGGGPFPTELLGEEGEKLRQLGGEFGATTGRPRRCGWMDLPALRYAAMLNGLTKLIITKIDVLNSFEELQVCTDYEVDGQTVRDLPYDLCSATVKPLYQNFKGWNQPITGSLPFEQLPEEITRYIAFIENYLNVPAILISTGPHRDDLVVRA
ncbi:MAG: adenylosuccinate synthase [Chitinophagales bacterium]|nr:adenylosuccinate synthase [Chitinophagales bacterium]